MVGRGFRVAVVAAFLAVPALLLAQPQYEVIRFNGMPGYFSARGLAADGTVTGYAETSSTGRIAYTWKNGVATALPGYAGFRSFGTTANSAGLVVGQAEVPPGGYGQAAIWQNGVFTNIGTVGGVPGSSGCVDVNESGWITGNSASPDGGGPFLYRNGVMESLGDLGHPTINLGGASAISDAGHIVGSFGDSENNNRRAFIWTEATGMQLLTNENMVAYDVNDLGQVLGTVRIGEEFLSFVWQSGSYVTYMPSSVGLLSINNHGDIVGSATGGGRLWQGQQSFRLNDLITEPGWHLSRAISINDGRQILVWATTVPGSTTEEWVLLNPVPEPSTLFILALLTVWFASRVKLGRSAQSGRR